MLDHITIDVRDFEQSKKFYLQALAPLGYELIMEFPEHYIAGFGVNGKPDFWIHLGLTIVPKLHIAFKAEKRALVDGFHKAALAAGATDNGAPGLREQYHPHYYGAFVLDPDGYNIEAVCHAPA